MNNIIIGNGLLAKSFKNSNSKGCIFYCSGVSNSNEKDLFQFEREKKLLTKSIEENPDKCLIYFSSVSAPSMINPYFEHKINMENLIQEKCSTYIILRLPRVAGPVLNNTLLSSLTKKIYLGEDLQIFDKAVRNLVDVDDIIKVFDEIYPVSNKNTIVNICPNTSFKPEVLVRLIAKELDNKVVNYKLVDAGDIETCILSSSIEEQIVHNYFLKKNNYLESIVIKYVPRILTLLQSSI